MTQHFLSCYLTPPGPTAVFSVRHDQNVALWRRDGGTVTLARLWEVERISGQKHHFWPLYTLARTESFLSALLAEEGLNLADISACWGTPGLPAAEPVPVPAGAEDFPVHSLAHLASGLMTDTRLFRQEQIIGMALDALPDYAQEQRPNRFWYAGCVSVQGRLSFDAVESPAPLYTAAETIFGQEPGTLMALASATTSRIKFDEVAAVDHLSLLGGQVQPWKTSFALLRAIIAEAQTQLDSVALDSSFSREENLRSAVMKVVQRCSELVAVRNIERLLERGGVRARECYLSTSGGYALNCPTNTLLMDRFGFRGLLTPPCSNDSGQAMGLGLLGLYGRDVFDEAEVRIASAYYGRDVTDADEALREFEPWVVSVSGFAPERFAADVQEGVVAWVDGRAEIGPRSLGHRSLLGDPRWVTTKDELNGYKQRQWWRPVAPVVMAEYVADWFTPDRDSPYMLEAVQVRADVRDRVPAIVHRDGSARHQVLSRDVNPRLHQAIDAFRAATGVPMLCNTSLNDRGESIVDTAAEALNFCVRKGLRVAYLAGRRVELRTGPVSGAAAPAGPRPRAVFHFTGQEADRDAIWESWIERGYTVPGMALLARSPDLRAELDQSTPDRVNQLASYRATVDPSFPRMAENFRRTHGPGAPFTDPAMLTGAFGVVNPLRRS
ncbi:MAG TPA: carbamoyltransferase C-terminal domain-containing protein [Streptosporangiaceae bacterium]|nr:carbamoyltransferase C-terminal domain-containing protein [Streptosporangiaceae bacterium]